MEAKEIQERNKQIALMLGWKEATLEYKLKWCSVPTEERLNRLNQEHVPILMKENQDPLWNSSLLWHSDWNWLMEAVEFIEKVKDEQGYGNMVNIWVNGCNVCENNAGYKIIENIFASTKKEAVFIAVSDFAKLYNEGKQ